MSDLASVVHSAVSKLEKSLGTLCVAAQLKQVTSSTYDANTATNSVSEAITDVKIVISSYTQFEIKGTDIQATDSKIIMFEAGVTPVSGNELVIGSDAFKVIHSEPVYVGSKAAMYTLQCRR